jgi:hypothetical protein
VIEPNATAKQIDSTWKAMNMLRDSIKSKMDESAHDRGIKIALKMIPKKHINFDYINPLIVVHDQSGRSNGTTALNSMALAIVRQPGRKSTRGRRARPRPRTSA